MRLKSKIAPLVLAGIVALGIVTVPAVAADAAAPTASSASSTQAKAKTGKLTVQLVRASGKAYTQKIELSVDGAKNYMVVSTNSKGAFTLTKLKPSSKYTIRYYGSNVYLPATKTAKVVAGKTTSVKLSVIAGATMAGTVKSSTGSAVEGIEVAALNKYGEPLSHAYTSSKGTYKLTGLKTGSYKVAFNSRASGAGTDLYDTTYWKKATTFKSAASIKVTNQTSKKAASAAKSISGTITKAPTQTLSGTVLVPGAQEVEIRNIDSWDYYTAEVVNGAFTTDVPYGDYYLATEAYNDYWDETDTAWYAGDDSPSVWDRDDAQVITLSAAAPVAITFNLPEDSTPAPQAEGEILGTADLPEGTTVYFADEDGNGDSTEVVDGEFFQSLPVSSYQVSAELYDEDADDFFTWWYTGDGVTLSRDQNDAVWVDVNEDDSTSISFGALPVQ